MTAQVFHHIVCLVSKTMKLSDGLVVCSLDHRRCVAALLMLYKICCNFDYALGTELPGFRVPERVTRLVVSVHSIYLDVHRARLVQ